MLIVGTDQMAFFASYLRHLLMLLDLRAEVAASPVAGGARPPGAHRRARRSSSACRAGRPHPLVVRAMKLARHRKARDDRDHRRDAVRGRQARADPPVLLVQQPGLRALAHRAAALIQALAYGVYAATRGQYEERIKAFRLK